MTKSNSNLFILTRPILTRDQKDQQHHLAWLEILNYKLNQIHRSIESICFVFVYQKSKIKNKQTNAHTKFKDLITMSMKSD